MNIGGMFCRKYSDSALGKIRGVLAQLVCHLINNESAARRERVMCLLKQVAFFFVLKNAERDSRNDVIALHDAALF